MTKITTNVFGDDFRVAFVGFGIDIEAMFVFLVTTRFHFLEGNTKFLFHKIKKCGTKCITKKGIVEMLFGAPETGVANTTFRDKTMDVRIPF